MGDKAEPGAAMAALSLKDRTETLLKTIREGKVPEYNKTASQFSHADLRLVKDDMGRSLLHHAAQNGHEKILALLVEDVGLDVNAQDNAGETALALAAAMGHTSVAQYLISSGAKHDLRRPNGPAPIHRAASCPDVAMIDVLASAGADVNMASDTGTPLCWAAGAGKHPAMEALLKHGAAVSAEPTASTAEGAGVAGGGGGGVSALILSCACGSLASVQLLLDQGTDASYQGRGGTSALHAVAAVDMDEGVSIRIVDLLLKAGAKADAVDDDGHTAIMLAAARGHRQLVQHLMPVSSAAPGVEWSVDSIMAHAKEKFKVTEDGPAAIGGKEIVKIPDPQKLDEEQAAKLKRLGDDAFVKQDYKTASEQYSESLRYATQNHLVWANRAASYLKLDKFIEALSDARISRAIMPTYAKAWYREGAAYAGLKRWEDAACAHFEACNIDPKNDELSRAFHAAIAEGRKEHEASKK